jgi:hypothetical protein
MATRIHILLDEADKVRYRQQAEREGKSLGAWLRIAAEERLQASLQGRSLRSRAEMERFFLECDEREDGEEPDWAEHRSVIERSRVQGLDVT